MWSSVSGIVTNATVITPAGASGFQRLQIRLDFNQDIGTNYFVAFDLDGVTGDSEADHGFIYWAQDAPRGTTNVYVTIHDEGAFGYSYEGYPIRIRIVKTDATAGGMGGDVITTANNVMTGSNSFTGGTITVPTQAVGTSNSTAASTAFVMQNRGSGGGGDVTGPASSVSNNLASFNGTTGKVIKDSGIATTNVLTITAGNAAYVPITASTTTVMTGAGLSNQMFFGAPTIYVGSTSVLAEVGLKAPLASPTFTGTPAAPTPSSGDNSTKLATTAWAQQEFDREAFADRWEEVETACIGGDEAKALYPWTGYGFSGGSFVSYFDPDSLRSGVVQFKSSADASTGTGVSVGQLNGFMSISNVVIGSYDVKFAATNDIRSRFGFGSSTATEPGDGVFLSLTNNRVYGVAISNSTKVVTSSGVSIPVGTWLVLKLSVTNSGATFSVRSNGVVLWSDGITNGVPVGRNVQFLSSAWTSGPSTTNSAVLLSLDRIYYRKSRQNR